MGEQLQASVKLINDKVQFSGQAGSNPAIQIDYVPPLGDGDGYTPLELVLVSLSACSGSTVASLLRRMGKTVCGLQVTARGVRRDAHPTGFESIVLEFTLDSGDALEADLGKAIQLSEQTYCPVWAMLKDNVEITSQYRVVA